MKKEICLVEDIQRNLVPFAIAALLGFVGLWHFNDMASFSLDTVRIGFVPYAIRFYLPNIVPTIEVCLAFMICFPVLRKIALWLNCGQFVLYIGYHAWNLKYGVIDSCHCLGITSFFELSPTASAIFMIGFNMGVIVLTIIWLYENRNAQSLETDDTTLTELNAQKGMT